MALVLTIAGVTKTLKAGSLQIAKTANGQTTASFIVVSTDGTYRPAIGAEVIIAFNLIRIFGGLVQTPHEQGIVQGSTAGIETSVTASDFNAYASRRIVKADYASQSLLATVTSLRTDYLNVFSVTLAAGLPSGPTLPVVSFDYVSLAEALNQLCTMSQKYGEPFAWKIDDVKEFSIFQPSTVAAPFNIVGTSLPIAAVIGDIGIEPSKELYANRVYIKGVPQSQDEHTESFTGDGVTDTYDLLWTPTRLLRGSIAVASGGAETFGVTGTLDSAGNPVQWWWDPTPNTITRNVGPTANGEVYTAYFDGTYAPVATAGDASATTDPWEKVITIEEVPADTTIDALADAYLAQFLHTPKTIRYITHTDGLAPGQTQTINVSRRNVNASAVITDVVIRDFLTERNGTQILEYEITAVIDADTNLNQGWRDDVRTWYGDKSSASTPTTAGAGTSEVGSTGGPGLPFDSVQFNRNGQLGGDAEFTYDEDTNSETRGTLSSITATSPDSCLAVGYDSHVTDP